MYRVYRIWIIIISSLLLGNSPPLPTHEPDSFLLDAVKHHDVVLLGTTHQNPVMLHFIAQLLPKLSRAGVTHIGLEITSDQQLPIDRFLLDGKKLEDIEISNIIDCPEYRGLFNVILRTHHLQPVALDLPRTMWQTSYTRDRWIAFQISQIFDQFKKAKVFVVVGNLHVIKKVDWIYADKKESFIRDFLSRYRPELKVFSIAECHNNSTVAGKFDDFLGPRMKPFAVSTKNIDMNLEMLNILAAKPMTAHEAVDAVIVY